MMAHLFLILYLLRDTVYRWSKRLSSPLSRLLVVLSLSFGGLVFLSSYALSIRLLEDKIAASGADLIIAGELVSSDKVLPGEGVPLIPARPGETELYTFHDLFASARMDNCQYQIVEYMPELCKLLPRAGRAIYVLPETPAEHMSPADLLMEGYRVEGMVLDEAHAGFLRKIYPSGAVFIPRGSFSLDNFTMGMLRKYVLRVLEPDVGRLAHWEQVFSLVSRLDERNMTIMSSRPMLQELAQLRQLQQRFRMGIVLGCSLVICLLLTSISSMEFRQNEYVYALMGSFGISRFWLFFTFVGENIVLVFGGFGLSLLALRHAGSFLIDKLYHQQDDAFSMELLHDDIHLFMLAFVFCVVVSCLPIMGAIFRPIGKILK